MNVLLLANQPQRTTRLKLFQGTLEELGYDVIVPKFATRNWIKISGLVKKLVKNEKPDVVHVFNVPDVIYHDLPKLKGLYFKKLIYDYRSPWGVEMQMSIGPIGRLVGERFEKHLASSSDAVTTVNFPLGEKVKYYINNRQTGLYIIPNYPSRRFNKTEKHDACVSNVGHATPIIFVGRVCEQEGIKTLLSTTKKFPDEEFWIVGSGPFAWWYLRNTHHNVKFFGWQPHTVVANLVKRSKLCLIPRKENVLTPYATDKSVWKLNEYLNLEKLVIASGISKEEDRKNLILVRSDELIDVVGEYLHEKVKTLNEGDYRFWEGNKETIREIYERIL